MTGGEPISPPGFFSSPGTAAPAARLRRQADVSGDGQKRRLQAQIRELQQLVIERDLSIHALNQQRIAAEADRARQQDLKQGFAAVSRRNVATTSMDSVLEDAMRLFLTTLVTAYAGTAGIAVLDVPYNSAIGASADARQKGAAALRCYWSDLDDRTPEGLPARLEDVSLFYHVVTQRKGKVFRLWELERLGARLGAADWRHVESLMAVPVVVAGEAIAVVVLVNGDYGPGDPAVLAGVLPELWTSNVAQLINDALDYRRKLETEEALVAETKLRDEFILSLDALIDRAVAAAQADGDASTDRLWRNVLSAVADFFEQRFSGDVMVAVTNAESNFKVHTVLKERSASYASAERGRSSRRGSGGSSKASGAAGGTEIIYYALSGTLRSKVEHGAAHAGLRPPRLHRAPFMRKVLEDGAPYYTQDASPHLRLPPGHMKVKSLLLVPIVFLDEPVGLLGLANGNFTQAHGRVLQSVFGTFWSMITKTCMLTESQEVLNAALHPQITERVKRGEAIADKYDAATVLFADIVGFTAFTRELRPIHVVEYSNLIFNELDKIVRACGLEKIKVIGDCYMVAGGMQDKSGVQAPAGRQEGRGQVAAMCRFALRILQHAAHVNKHVDTLPMHDSIRAGFKRKPLQFRVGIAAGPLVAGLFGSTKLQYDIIGATVTRAAALEGAGQPGRVHVGPNVRAALEETLHGAEFRFEKRAPTTLKGQGLVQTYFLKPAEAGAGAEAVEVGAASPHSVSADEKGGAGAGQVTSPCSLKVSQVSTDAGEGDGVPADSPTAALHRSVSEKELPQLARAGAEPAALSGAQLTYSKLHALARQHAASGAHPEP
eukprot:TRINITY_DN1116_c0_g1_i1.p1 TRINITY_DN1116_c0_g1~~TRINITY_DN1116_c0_g1_i1.p1  ORF type:complete len:833 (+),score=305.70 TRINITY_DN1116_c0_g1_i1:62-2560(+)